MLPLEKIASQFVIPDPCALVELWTGGGGHGVGDTPPQATLSSCSDLDVVNK